MEQTNNQNFVTQNNQNLPTNYSNSQSSQPQHLNNQQNDSIQDLQNVNSTLSGTDTQSTQQMQSTQNNPQNQVDEFQKFAQDLQQLSQSHDPLAQNEYRQDSQKQQTTLQNDQPTISNSPNNLASSQTNAQNNAQNNLQNQPQYTAPTNPAINNSDTSSVTNNPINSTINSSTPTNSPEGTANSLPNFSNYSQPSYNQTASTNNTISYSTSYSATPPTSESAQDDPSSYTAPVQNQEGSHTLGIIAIILFIITIVFGYLIFRKVDVGTSSNTTIPTYNQQTEQSNINTQQNVTYNACVSDCKQKQGVCNTTAGTGNQPSWCQTFSLQQCLNKCKQ